MKTSNTNRASNAIDFLRSELGHCEDMLQYLDDNNQEAEKRNQFDSDDIDIDVTNYRIKLTTMSKNKLINGIEDDEVILKNDNSQKKPIEPKKIKKKWI